MMVLRLDAKVLEYGICPEAFHVVLSSRSASCCSERRRRTYPVLDLTMSNWIMDTVA